MKSLQDILNLKVTANESIDNMIEDVDDLKDKIDPSECDALRKERCETGDYYIEFDYNMRDDVAIKKENSPEYEQIITLKTEYGFPNESSVEETYTDQDYFQRIKRESPFYEEPIDLSLK